MKKLLCVFLSAILLVSLTTTAFAATAQKITVTAEKTAIREKASASSKAIVTAKKEQSFKAVGSTKSFWKVEFKKKNDTKIYTGYILKKDVKETAAKTTTASATKETANWAKIYGDYLSTTFEFKTWNFDGNKYTSWGNASPDPRNPPWLIAKIEFRQIDGRKKPILVINGGSLGGGGREVPYAIKNNKVVGLEGKEYDSLFGNTESGFPIIVEGKILASFPLTIYDPETGSVSDQKAMQTALSWLEKQK